MIHKGMGNKWTRRELSYYTSVQRGWNNSPEECVSLLHFLNQFASITHHLLNAIFSFNGSENKACQREEVIFAQSQKTWSPCRIEKSGKLLQFCITIISPTFFEEIKTLSFKKEIPLNPFPLPVSQTKNS